MCVHGISLAMPALAQPGCCLALSAGNSRGTSATAGASAVLVAAVVGACAGMT